MNSTPKNDSLRHLAKEYYNKIFKINYSTTTLLPNTLPLL